MVKYQRSSARDSGVGYAKVACSNPGQCVRYRQTTRGATGTGLDPDLPGPTQGPDGPVPIGYRREGDGLCRRLMYRGYL